MTQQDRDRLVVLKKAQKKLITQKQAAAELDLCERQIRRLLKRLATGGPTLASYHLAKEHGIGIGRETLRHIMKQAGLWRAKKQKVKHVHVWRPRRSCRGDAT
jgi:hypothetical protein